MADIAHPNLVLPLELLCGNGEGGETALVMEYVNGTGLLEFLRALPTADRIDRLDGILTQLAAALAEIHGRGLIHRDVKPSNILVTPSGRIVLLDYGFVVPSSLADATFLGTPIYMSPEVVRGQPATAAADWYAVGTILYEVITGAPPFPRDIASNLAAKSGLEPAPTLEVADCPAALAGLTHRLLASDPTERAGRDAVYAYLGLTRPSGEPLHGRSRDHIVGRDAELARLMAISDNKHPPGLTLVRLHGAPGMGKSSLMSAWLQEAAQSAQVWVLCGRCYERDATPYQALDDIIAQLAEAIERLPLAYRPSFEPLLMDALARGFPTIGLGLGATHKPGVDPVSLRHDAYLGMSRTMNALVAGRRVIIAIDDLQWGDADSAELLLALAAGSAVPMTIVLAYRTDERDASPFLSALSAPERLRGDLVIDVPVGAVASEHARRIVASVMPTLGDSEVDAIVQEADGCPFLLERNAAAKSLAPAQSPTPGEPSQVPESYARSRSALEADTLRLVSVAGRPLPTRVLAAASSNDSLTAVVTSLRNHRLIRTSGVGEMMVLDTYHARIRASVVAELRPDASRTIHRRLAEAMLASGASDAELLCRHFAASDAPQRAVPYALAAAEHALDLLAFDHASSLFRLALSVVRPEDPTLDRARRGLARSLELAGRGREAGQTLLACAAEGPPDRQALLRLAADQFLISGHLQEATPITRTLLREAGLVWPESRLRARWVLLEAFLRMLLAAPRSEPWAGAAPSDAIRFRIELYSSIGRGLSSYDALRAPTFIFEAARLSLRHGHDDLATLGMSYLGFVTGLSGKLRATRKAARWLDAARQLATVRGDARGLHFARVVAGIIAVCRLRWAQAVQALDEGIAGLEADCVGVQWEIATAKATLLHAIFYRGDMTALRARTGAYARDARSRGDLALETEARLYTAANWLADDDIAHAHDAIAQAIANWQSSEFQYQHWIALRFEAYAHLYASTVTAAFVQRYDEGSAKAHRAGLTAMQVMRVEIAALRGLLALARGLGERDEAKALRRALAALRKEPDCPVAEAMAQLLDAEQAASDPSRARARAPGDLRARAQGLEAARDRFHACGMPAHRAAVSFRLAGVNDNAEERKRALNALRALGVAAPERFARMLLPH